MQALCIAGSSIQRQVNGVQASRADMIIAVGDSWYSLLFPCNFGEYNLYLWDWAILVNGHSCIILWLSLKNFIVRANGQQLLLLLWMLVHFSPQHNLLFHLYFEWYYLVLTLSFMLYFWPPLPCYDLLCCLYSSFTLFILNHSCCTVFCLLTNI